ncbi:iron-siderophore ABC transporter substrate-binding protein [Microbacterium awajiense]|uniref:Iron-siderophore ABC transporter substrate-binding protein n=1 Tax=Microbacterium awajiense TaxID=415214 RepID=A0ABP7A3E3_9MICO
MTRSRTRLGIATAALTAATLALTACAGESTADPAEAAPAEAGFPVTISDAFGEATIETAPERVVTWGWSTADAVLALGVVPVAIPAQPYGGDEDGVLPWIDEKLQELGAETPTILDSATGEVPIQEIAAADPDLFLAPYSGLTQEEYDQLTGLGIPVVAYPDQPWATPWRDVISITGQALGKSDEAAALLDDIDAQVSDTAAEHPEFAGLTVAQVWDTAGTFYLYLPADPRVEFTEDLGFVSAPSIADLDSGESTFYTTVGYENLDRLTSDVLVAYADTQEQMDEFLASDQARLLPQVATGAVAQVVGPAQIAAVSPPTALSLTWGLDAYVDALTQAVAALR